MVRSIFRSRRFDPAHAEEEQAQVQPFFTKVPPQGGLQGKQKPFFQAKLAINQPNDKYEQEADSIANAVVNNPASAPVVQQKNISNIQRQSTTDEERLGTHEARMLKDKELQEKPDIQRLCPECEKEKEMGGVQRMTMPEEKKKDEMMQRMAMPEEKEEEEKMVQPKAEGTSTTASPSLSNQIENTRGKGKPLSTKTRAEMESSFGTDFSQVNIHTDASAVEMNKDLSAQAFTHGRDIYFNAGKYNPETSVGKQLLAHELTHVVQQGGIQKKAQLKPVNNPVQKSLPVKRNLISNTVHCLKRWTYCSAPYSPGSWGARLSYHCPIWPGFPGTTQNSYVTIPDEFIGTGPGGGRQYRCRHRPKTMTLLTVADAAATGINLNIIYPDQQSCHEGYRRILRIALEGLFAPAGGGPSGIRVNASVPVGGFPC
jgi:hypothetical protein